MFLALLRHELSDEQATFAVEAPRITSVGRKRKATIYQPSARLLVEEFGLKYPKEANWMNAVLIFGSSSRRRIDAP
jgi:hypothetical protein